MKKKIQFAVVLTKKQKTILVINNEGIYKSNDDWQKLFNVIGGQVIYTSETDSIDINLSHFYI